MMVSEDRIAELARTVKLCRQHRPHDDLDELILKTIDGDEDLRQLSKPAKQGITGRVYDVLMGDILAQLRANAAKEVEINGQQTEVKATLLKGDAGWEAQVRHKRWRVSYRVTPDGTIKKISWTGRWMSIPEQDREAIWQAVLGWWRQKNRDRVRSVPYSQGDNCD